MTADLTQVEVIDNKVYACTIDRGHTMESIQRTESCLQNCLKRWLLVSLDARPAPWYTLPFPPVEIGLRPANPKPVSAGVFHLIDIQGVLRIVTKALCGNDFAAKCTSKQSTQNKLCENDKPSKANE